MVSRLNPILFSPINLAQQEQIPEENIYFSPKDKFMPNLKKIDDPELGPQALNSSTPDQGSIDPHSLNNTRTQFSTSPISHLSKPQLPARIADQLASAKSK